MGWRSRDSEARWYNWKQDDRNPHPELGLPTDSQSLAVIFATPYRCLIPETVTELPLTSLTTSAATRSLWNGDTSAITCTAAGETTRRNDVL